MEITIIVVVGEEGFRVKILLFNFPTGFVPTGSGFNWGSWRTGSEKLGK